ncbi:hypothetical protein TRS1_16 [Acinetobacter phage vB_AbaS_TRS1]|nr:hypothetical protein TRS1_16 [Acinetobacter phage vB_AbaS_TRS1]ANT40728.1 hypothetical protein TRS1_16 [Acinetobacter phage vB_AbaS_TRS1]
MPNNPNPHRRKAVFYCLNNLCTTFRGGFFMPIRSKSHVEWCKDPSLLC